MSNSQAMFIRPLHIVHIDDSTLGREVVKTILSESTYPCFVVHSFPSIDAVKSLVGTNIQQIDCVLLDLLLAESEGIDTFTRAVTIFSSVPVIVLTGVDDIDLAYQLVSYGADNYLNKGESIRQLPVFICAAMARRHRPTIPAKGCLDTVIQKALTSTISGPAPPGK